MDKLLEMAKKLHDMNVQLSKLSWVQYTSGFDFGIEKAYMEVNDFLQDKANYDLVMEYKNKDLDKVNKRRAEIAYNIIKPYHLSNELNELNIKIQNKTNELSMLLNTFRFKLDGKEVSSVELSQIISENDDRELRKKAFFSRNQINKPLVDAGFIDLIKMRKEYAHLNGDKDFVEYSLKRDELNTDIFKDWKNHLKPSINILKEKEKYYAQKYLDADEIMPWDSAYISSKISPSMKKTTDMTNYYEVLNSFFLKFGFDLNKYNITYDVFSRKNKSEWGYNFPIQTGIDSRILANVKNKYREYGVLLHESGHGLHSFLLNPDEILLNIGISGIITEGIANLFGDFIYDEIFYQGIHDKSVAEEFNELREFNKLNNLKSIGNIFFDQELYRNNIESLDDIYNLYFNVHNDLLGEKPYGEAPPFGYKIHHTTHPIYMHNYFMGDVTCEMIKKVFCETNNIKSVTENPLEFGKFVVNEVIEPSGLYTYEELFEKISGSKFSLSWYLE